MRCIFDDDLWAVERRSNGIATDVRKNRIKEEFVGSKTVSQGNIIIQNVLSFTNIRYTYLVCI